MTALARPTVVIDPLRRMFTALEDAGCGPQGDAWKFRARCPVHRGDSRSLAVAEGADGRVVLFCHAHGCEPTDILSALGLGWADCFPIGHRHGPKLAPKPKRSRTPPAALLDSLTFAGSQWEGDVYLVCPYCGGSGARFHLFSQGGMDFYCPGDCAKAEALRALESRVAIAEAGVRL